MKRLFKRYRKSLNRFFVVVVVSVCLINTVSLDAQAAKTVNYAIPYLQVYFGRDTVVDMGKPVSGSSSSFQILKNSSAQHVVEQYYGSFSDPTPGAHNGSIQFDSAYVERAFFSGVFQVGLKFVPSGELADLFSDSFINFTRLEVYIPFRLTSLKSTTGEPGTSNPGVLEILNGVFDIPTVITLPNGGAIYSTVEKTGTSSYVLDLTLKNVSYRSGSMIKISLPYYCAGSSAVDHHFFDNLNVGVQGNFSVYPEDSGIYSGYIQYSYAVAESGRATTDKISDNIQDLVDGYDDTEGNAASGKLDGSASDFEQVEGSIFDSAQGHLKDFEFFDFNSIPAVVTGLSFVTSSMTAVFDAMGGLSGAGIVLSVLFAVMFLSIVIGLYRYFK